MDIETETETDIEMEIETEDISGSRGIDMIYITFTGNKPYPQSKYSFEDNKTMEVYDSCIQAAVIHRYLKEITKIFVFLTKDDGCTQNFDYIKEVVANQNLNIEVEKVIYDLSDGFKELLEKVQSIVEDEDELILGITNTFRNIPLSVVQILPYVQAYKNLNIKHIYYGKKILNKDELIIQDYVDYFFNSKLIDYFSQFKQSLRVPPDLKGLENTKVKRLLGKMYSLNTQRLRSEIYAELVCLKDIYNMCVELSEEETIYKIYIEDLIQDLKWTQEGNVYVQINQMACYMFSKGYYQHAVTILDRNRSVITSAILLGDGKIKTDRKIRTKKALMEIADELIRSLDGTISIAKIDKTEYLSNITKTSMKKIFKKSAINNFRVIKNFTDIRNTIDHGLTFSNASELNKVKKEIESVFVNYAYKLSGIAEIQSIWLEEPEKLYVGNIYNPIYGKKGIIK